MRRPLPPFLLAVFIAAAAWAEGPGAYPPLLEIQEIARDPQSYHMHDVALKGTARGVKALPPYACTPPITGMSLPPAAGEAVILRIAYQCYGAYTFTIEDATGSLPVQSDGVCCTPEAAIRLTEGDTVSLTGTVMWDHAYPGTASVHASAVVPAKP